MNKANPNEAPEGYIAVEQPNNLCTGCALWHKSGGCKAEEGIGTNCIASVRMDGVNVIFVKKQIYTEDVLESLIKECKVQDYMRSDIEFFASKVFEAGVKFGKEQTNKELN